MKESHRENPITLYSKRKQQIVESNSDSSSQNNSEDDMEALVASAALIVKRFGGKSGRKFNGPGMYDSRTSSSALKRSDAERRTVAEMKNDGKCFNSGSTNHFSRDCTIKKNESFEESYKAKY